MSAHELDGGHWAGRFADPPAGAPAGQGCARPERILEAVLGRAPRSEARALADHAATCAACATAWRLARHFAHESGMPQARRSRARRRTTTAVTALAAAVVIGALWVGRDAWRPAHAPTYRSVPHETIRSLVADEALPADAFALRWSADHEGARYDVRVTDRRLNLIAEGRSLNLPEYTVPAEALRAIAGGETLLWQVEAHLPDGRKLESPTFTARLE